VRIAGTGEIGAVTGLGHSQSGPAALRLQVFDASAVLAPGQQLVTFGSAGGRPYVPGVPVGVITRVVASASALTKIAYVRPYADEGALGVVGVVIVPPRHNPRDSVLPARPASPAGATPSAGSSASPRASPGGAATAAAGGAGG
jgi:rod shape-determining protein MreC